MKSSARLFLLLVLLTGSLLQAETKKPVSLTSALLPFVDKNELAGAVMLVANKSRIITIETVGRADIAADRPMAKDDLFWIASMTKPMTAAAFMMLVDEGKVKLGDRVTKHLPEFREQMVIAKKDDDQILLKKPKQPILIRHLLNHTSGLPFTSALEIPTLDMLRLETAVRSYAAAPLLSEPGTTYLYSNEGINTLGRIIEIISGMSYQEFMQKRLLEPLSMKDTTFFPSEEQLKRLVKTYKPKPGSKSALEETRTGYLRFPLSDPARQPMPGGGLFSTAEDVAHFCQMILNNGTFRGQRLLSEESVSQMITRQTPETLKESYGYGFTVSDHGVGHGGALSTNMTIIPSMNFISIYLVQHEGFPGQGKTAGGAFISTALNLYGPLRP
ncbi:beta-lactamase family protein [Phragmitibacter flavus]|uniref:Beta-lactamase family protein n=1 Tax=Phragmitibacter flavus TaxID=2576071 RepID=A0A5R8KDK5_9BACT|nr:serine hydrolase domain-containing protein [Phragmitibacter flavus]TLD70381.1 beta-lactamase family protein [Phragmitibacter flavus]